MTEGHAIERLEATRHSLTITLANGVTVVVASNEGYMHLHLSGIGTNPIKVNQQAANNVNIGYVPRAQR